MKLKIYYFILILFTQFFYIGGQAKMINANSGNYTTYLNGLLPGDTLYLASGNYTNNLTLNTTSGTSTKPIVIIGSGTTTVFQGQSCCNTISLTKCSYIIIKNLKLDGLNQALDAVKAEGTTGNWAHHITIEYLTIINYGSSQQNVGISTKCPVWDWVIRKNKIIGAGTGMYLGNSDGTKPFVNGLIEYNYIANTVGYNIEIKHQVNGQRELLTETSVNGKTILRHNVFTKDATSSTGGNARPNLLVGGFATTGWGSQDYYEIYGNFFYNNPVEALFQGTGNIRLYENIFVNHFDPSGFRAVYITPQNGVSPQDIQVFHNTIWAANSSGGLRLYNPNTGFKQYCYANVVFTPSPITNFTDTLNNITGSYSNFGYYVQSATASINTLDLYPKSGQLKGILTPKTSFQNSTDYNQDFNLDTYDWTYRGAYSGNAVNKGWKLQLDTMAKPKTTIGIPIIKRNPTVNIYPNPVINELIIEPSGSALSQIEIYNASGSAVFISKSSSSPLKVDFTNKLAGIYFVQVKNGGTITSQKVIKQ